jgi:hypothetical protein
MRRNRGHPGERAPDGETVVDKRWLLVIAISAVAILLDILTGLLAHPRRFRALPRTPQS